MRRSWTSPIAEVKAHWPSDAVEVTVAGKPAWILADDLGDLGAEVDVPDVRMLGITDLFTQARDRDLLIPDTSKHNGLWPTIGRPGAVLAGGEIVGTWRPRSTGKKFTVRLDMWDRATKAVLAAIEEQAELLARHRGATLAGVVEERGK